MAEAFSAPTASRRRIPTRALIGLGLATFLLGAVAVWLLAGSPGLPPIDLFTVRDEQAAPRLVTPAPTATSSQAERVMAETQGGLDQRVAAMEQRLARLDLQTQAAAGNAARAEGL